MQFIRKYKSFPMRVFIQTLKEDVIMKIIKEELKQKKENAMVYTVKFSGDESTRIKIREEYEAIPINGLDLLKCCAYRSND